MIKKHIAMKKLARLIKPFCQVHCSMDSVFCVDWFLELIITAV